MHSTSFLRTALRYAFRTSAMRSSLSLVTIPPPSPLNALCRNVRSIRAQENAGVHGGSLTRRKETPEEYGRTGGVGPCALSTMVPRHGFERGSAHEANSSHRARITVAVHLIDELSNHGVLCHRNRDVTLAK